jgi:tetratricopeptide (TPR) repeat protein
MVDLKEQFEQAKSLFKQQDYEESEKIYTTILKEIRDNKPVDKNLEMDALQGVGDCLREQLYFEEAIPYYEDIIKLSKDNKKAMLGMADSYRGLKDWDKAMEFWFTLLKLDPHDYLVATRIADAYRKKNDFANSEKYYLISLDLNSKNKFALMGVGDLYYKHKKYNRALEYWKQLLEINPKFINILTMVGNIYRTWKQYDKAIDYYQKALEIDRNNFYALYGIADSLRGKKRFRDAIKYWKKILSKEPSNDRILTRLGDCYIKIGKVDDAEVIYHDVLKTSSNKYAMIGLIRIQIDKKDWENSITMCLEYLNKHPNDARLVLLLAKIYDDSGQKDKTMEVYDKYSSIFNDKKEFTSKLASSTIESFQNDIEEFTDHNYDKD